MIFPTSGQITVHHRAEYRAQLGMFLHIARHQLVPLRFGLRAAIDCFSEMGERFIGNVELFVLRPAKMSLGFADCFFAGRIAVRFARAGRRHAVTNGCLDGNQRRSIRDGLSVTNRSFDRPQ